MNEKFTLLPPTSLGILSTPWGILSISCSWHLGRPPSPNQSLLQEVKEGEAVLIESTILNKWPICYVQQGLWLLGREIPLASVQSSVSCLVSLRASAELGVLLIIIKTLVSLCTVATRR